MKLTSLLFTVLLLTAACGKDEPRLPAADAGTDMPTDAATPPDAAPLDDLGGDAGADAGRDAATDSSHPDAADAGATSLTVDEYIEGLQRVYCEAWFECPNRRSIGALMTFGAQPSVESCAQYPLARTFLGLSVVPSYGEQSLADGHLVYDGEAAAQCVAQTKAYICDEIATDRPAACNDVFRGTLPQGATCRPESCAPGLRCVRDTECYGVCEPVSTACGACADNQYCDFNTSTCRARVGDSAACPIESACEDGLICDGDPGTCRVPGVQAKGEPCLETEACGRGLVCGGSTCQPYFVVDEGFACGDLPALQICGPGLICFDPEDDPIGTCQPPRQLGESCFSGFNCAPDLYCDGVSGVCQATKPFGASCTSDAQCTSRACDAGLCVPLDFGSCDLP